MGKKMMNKVAVKPVIFYNIKQLFFNVQTLISLSFLVLN